MLLEGASLLLLRVLARRQTMLPDLVFPAINTEGDLCTSSYVSQQPAGSWDGEGSGSGWGWHQGGCGSGQSVTDSMGGHMGMAPEDRGDSETWLTPGCSQSALGIQRQAVGSAETEVFVIQRDVHTSTGTSTVWHSSFLPDG